MSIALIYFFIFNSALLQPFILSSWVYALIGFLLVLIAWTERKRPMSAWLWIAYCQIFFMLSVIAQYPLELKQVFIYLSGIGSAFFGGLFSIYKLSEKEGNIDLNDYHGHSYEHPRYTLLFLISALTMIGLPISPSFIGLDLLFINITSNHKALLFINALTFLILELAILRIYARLFLGSHKKAYHNIAFKST